MPYLTPIKEIPPHITLDELMSCVRGIRRGLATLPSPIPPVLLLKVEGVQVALNPLLSGVILGELERDELEDGDKTEVGDEEENEWENHDGGDDDGNKGSDNDEVDSDDDDDDDDDNDDDEEEEGGGGDRLEEGTVYFMDEEFVFVTGQGRGFRANYIYIKYQSVSTFPGGSWCCELNEVFGRRRTLNYVEETHQVALPPSMRVKIIPRDLRVVKKIMGLVQEMIDLQLSG